MYSEVFIKAYKDVMDTDKALHKLRTSLHEALSKLQMVFNALFVSFYSQWMGGVDECHSPPYRVDSGHHH